MEATLKRLSRPKELERICNKAMAEDPAERYPGARALADEIDHWLRERQMPADRLRFSAAIGGGVGMAAAALILIGLRPALFSASALTASVPGVGLAAAMATDSTTSIDLIGNEETHLYHRSDCILAQSVETRNRHTFADIAQANREGFRPCARCDPQPSGSPPVKPHTRPDE